MIKSLTVVNPKGEQLKLELTRPESSGLIVRSISGLGPSNADINTFDLATIDGSIYSSARLRERNIVIELQMMFSPTVEDARLRTYRYFPIKKKVKLILETDNHLVEIEGYVESNEPDIFSDEETTQISILCVDPYFYEVGQTRTIFSGVQPRFEFEFENNSVYPEVEEEYDIYRFRFDAAGSYNEINDFSIKWGDYTEDLAAGGGINVYNPMVNDDYALLFQTNDIRPPYGSDLTPDLFPIVFTIGSISAEFNSMDSGVEDPHSSSIEKIRFSGKILPEISIFTKFYDVFGQEYTRKIFSYCPETFVYLNQMSDPIFSVPQTSVGTESTPYPFDMTIDQESMGLIPDFSFRFEFNRTPDSIEWTYPEYPDIPEENLESLYNGIIYFYIGIKSEDFKVEYYRKKIVEEDPGEGAALAVNDISEDEGAEEDPLAGNFLEMGEIVLDTRATLIYDGDVDVGVLINIQVLGDAENITIFNVDTREQMKIDTMKVANLVGSVLKRGDVIEISTVKGNKYARFLRKGIYTNIIGALDKHADWFQLSVGPNTFTFTAETGDNNLVVTFSYKTAYGGV